MKSGFKIYTAKEITEMCDTWNNFNGFSGETCGKCKKTANVFAYSAGWFCDCGNYNIQSWSNAFVSHENPDMGTPSAIIQEGVKNSKRWQSMFNG